MRLISYHPLRSFDRVASLQDLLGSAISPNGSGFSTDHRGPALEVHEDSEKITVSLEVAGFRKEDFEISLHEGELTVSGERKAETREGETLRSERHYGRFTRTVSLGSSAIRTEDVSATYTDGVLGITLPKSEEAKPRKIAVS